MNIYFFNFAKKDNSTAVPSETGAVYDCAIKAPSSIQAPVIELKLATVPTFNYCYIPDFERYYFITGTTYNRGLWELAARVDVLGSFRAEIAGTTMYIERSSAAQTGTLIDNMYPVKDTYTENNTVIEYGNLIPWTGGVIVVSIINGTSSTGMVAYQFSPSQFTLFLAGLMGTDTDSSVSTWDSLTQSIKVTTYEPLRYIGACYWFPDSFSVGSAVTSLQLGNYTATGFTCYPLYTAASPKTVHYTVSLPKHPQASARGSFCNLKPFSEYDLTLSSFGNIKLDSAALATATSLDISIKPDPFTGMARCIVETDSGALLANVAAQWGVPLRISTFGQFSVANILGTAGAAAAFVGGAITGNAGDIVGGLSGTVQGIENMLKGSFDTVGSTGAIIDHQTDKVLYARFYTIADDDNANNGRPLCAKYAPSSIPGYIKAQKGIVASKRAVRSELDAVNNYMEVGFYYE